MSSQSPPPTRPRNAPATRDAIFAAARRLFTERGYDAVGIRDIADNAGVNSSLVVRYFGGKEALFQAIVTEGFRFDSLVTGERARFGEQLVRYTLQKEGSGALDPLLLLLRSAASEGAGEPIRTLLNERFVTPLSRWLGGANASERAALIAAQMIGLTFLRFVVKLDALANADRDFLVAQTAPTIQRWVNGTEEG